MTYTQYRNTQETLQILDDIEVDPDGSSEDRYIKFGLEDKFRSNTLNWWHKVKVRTWTMFEEPYSSTSAKVRILFHNILKFINSDNKTILF